MGGGGWVRTALLNGRIERGSARGVLKEATVLDISVAGACTPHERWDGASSSERKDITVSVTALRVIP
jgi:hypothetical protein